MPAFACCECVLFLFLFLAPTRAVPAIDVRGNTRCPTPSEVSGALVGLVVPPSASTAAPDVVELRGQGTTVSVRLANASGEVIAEKPLPESLACAERARMAAVMVAAWQARLRAGLPPMLSVSPDPAAASATVPASAPLTPAPAQVFASPRPSENPRRDAQMLTADAPTRSPTTIEIETGAALLASVAAGSISPAAILEATFLGRDSRFALGIGALAVGTHATIVGSGQGTWRRFGGILDLRSASKWGPLELEMHAGLVLSAVAIAGQALPVTSGATVFDPGLLGGPRLRFRLGRLAPWVQASLAFWPRTHGLYVTGTANSSELPAFEGFLGGGVSLGPDR